MAVTIVPVWEMYCECGWSSCAESFAEAEDRAGDHEATHQIPQGPCQRCGSTAVLLGERSTCLKCHAYRAPQPSGGSAA